MLVYEYRVFVTTRDGETDVAHFGDEKLWPGAVFRAHRPGTKLHGVAVLVDRISSHPTPDGPGIAHARTQ
jgi:hypothetical protein